MLGEWEEAQVDFRVAHKIDKKLIWCKKLSQMKRKPGQLFLILGGTGYEPVMHVKNGRVKFISASQYSSLYLKSGRKRIKLHQTPDSHPWYVRHMTRNNLLYDIIKTGSDYLNLYLGVTDNYRYVRFLPQYAWVGWSKRPTRGQYEVYNRENKLTRVIKPRKYIRRRKTNIYLSYYSDSAYDRLKASTNKKKLKDSEKIIFSLYKYKDRMTNYIFKNHSTEYELLLLLKWNRLWRLPEFYEMSKLENINFFNNLYILGVFIDKKDKSGNTGLINALHSNNFLLTKFFLGNGADATQTSYFKKIPFSGEIDYIREIQIKNFKIAQLLIKYGAKVNMPIRRMNSELISKSSNGDLKSVKIAILIGADINAKDEDGYTVLMNASYKGYLEIVKYLIFKGADVKTERHSYDEWATALTLALRRGNLEIAKYLISKGADVNYPLIIAADNGKLNKIKFLLLNGADINFKSRHRKETVLMYASRKGHLGIVKYLISKGASVNLKNKRGASALTEASAYRHAKIVQYLKSKGAKE